MSFLRRFYLGLLARWSIKPIARWTPVRLLRIWLLTLIWRLRRFAWMKDPAWAAVCGIGTFGIILAIVLLLFTIPFGGSAVTDTETATGGDLAEADPFAEMTVEAIETAPVVDVQPERPTEPPVTPTVAETEPTPVVELPEPVASMPIEEPPAEISFRQFPTPPAEERKPEAMPVAATVELMPAETPAEPSLEMTWIREIHRREEFAGPAEQFSVSSSVLPDQQLALLATDNRWKRATRRVEPTLQRGIGLLEMSVAKSTATEAIDEALIDSQAVAGIAIAKRAPQESNTAVPFTYEIDVRNTTDQRATSIVLEEQLPDLADVIEVSPPAVQNGDGLRWEIAALEPGTTKTFRVAMLAGDRSVVQTASTVSVTRRIRAVCAVTGPKITLTIAAVQPSTDGKRIPVTFAVSNTGKQAIEDVWLYTDVPRPLVHPHGTALEFEVGKLAAGETRQTTLLLARAPESVNTAATIQQTAWLVVNGTERSRQSTKIQLTPAQTSPKPAPKPVPLQSFCPCELPF